VEIGKASTAFGQLANIWKSHKISLDQTVSDVPTNLLYETGTETINRNKVKSF